MTRSAENARRRRRSARDLMRSGPQPPFEGRLWLAGAVAAVSVLIPFLTPLAAKWVRWRIGPSDPQVLLWWPMSESHAALPMFAGVVAAVILGVGVLARGKAVLGRAVWVWLVLAFAASASAFLSLDSSVRIYSDRVVVADGAATKALPAGTYPFDSADHVMARCRQVSRSRQSDYATMDYVVHFPDVGWIAFDDAREDGPGAARVWFRKLAQVDAKGLRQIPHEPAQEPAVSCIRALRAELGEEDFANARRMMVLSDDDFERYYAEPHEAFKRKSDDGL